MYILDAYVKANDHILFREELKVVEKVVSFTWKIVAQ